MMKTFAEYLTETNEQYLYHGTGSLNAAGIVESNVLGPDGHAVKHLGKVYENLISCSRTYRFSYLFAKIRTYQPLVFELDRTLLAQKYKIMPYSFTRMPKISFTDPQFGNQMEEMIAGPIWDADRYIRKIIIKDGNWLDSYQDLDSRIPDVLRESPKLYIWDEKKFVNKNRSR